jgi:hypothetical protein
MEAETPPPETRVLIALRGEVKSQCYRARSAALALDGMLEADALVYNVDLPRGIESAIVHYHTEIWSRVHTILSAAGVVTRILFPKPVPKRLENVDPPDQALLRLQRANERAEVIWKEWSLPPRETLKPLTDAAVRNAMEHAENGAPEWFESREEWPLFAYGIGKTPEPGKPSGARGAYRHLFLDSRRVKIGSEPCDLSAILACLKSIEDMLPSKAKIDFVLPLFPVRAGPDGKMIQLNACPLSSRPTPFPPPKEEGNPGSV